MPIDMNNLNPATRFYWEEYVEGIPDEHMEWVDLRLVPEVVQNKMRRECGIKPKSEYRRDKAGRPHRIEFIDVTEENMKRFNDLLVDFSIVGWRLVDGEGNQIPCNTENKLLLHGEMPAFRAWYDSKMEFLSESIEAHKREQLENL